MLSQKEPFYLMILEDLVLHTLGADFQILFDRIYGIVPQLLLGHLHLTVESLQFSMLHHHVLHILLKFVCGYWLIWYKLR